MVPDIVPNLSLSCYGPDPIGTTRTFTASTDIRSAIAIYFDGAPVGSGLNTTSVSFTVTGTVGTHIVEAIATVCESASAVCNWYVYDLSCGPTGSDIGFRIWQYRVKGCAWTTALCNENAIARWGYASKDKNEFADTLKNIEWRKNEIVCEASVLPFLGPNDSAHNKDLYLASSSGNGHVMVAELSDGGVITNFSDLRFYQFDDSNITPQPWTGDPANPQMPWGHDGYSNTISIWKITGITINGCSIEYEHEDFPEAEFLISDTGVVTLQGS